MHSSVVCAAAGHASADNARRHGTAAARANFGSHLDTEQSTAEARARATPSDKRLLQALRLDVTDAIGVDVVGERAVDLLLGRGRGDPRPDAGRRVRARRSRCEGRSPARRREPRSRGRPAGSESAGDDATVEGALAGSRNRWLMEGTGTDALGGGSASACDPERDVIHTVPPMSKMATPTNAATAESRRALRSLRLPAWITRRSIARTPGSNVEPRATSHHRKSNPGRRRLGGVNSGDSGARSFAAPSA